MRYNSKALRSIRRATYNAPQWHSLKPATAYRVTNPGFDGGCAYVETYKCTGAVASALMSDRRETIRWAESVGIIEQHGLRCGHEHDCCGCLFLVDSVIKRVRGGIRFSQYFSRNI